LKSALRALFEPRLLLAGIGVGICSSVIPYICDQFAMARLNARIQSHQVDHSPMYTEPDLVINVILEAASETLSRQGFAEAI
jgi:threonine/homoserine efflux transporter RhtA